MSLLSGLYEKRTQTYKLSSGDLELVNMFGGTSSKSSQNVTTNTSMTVSAVYACVNRKAKTLAMLPLNVMKRLDNGGKEIAYNHRLYRQLHDRPNKWQTSYDWRLMMQSNVMLRGNAYSYILYHPGRGINELIPMCPDRVFPFMMSSNGNINYINDTSQAPTQGDTLWYQYFSSDGQIVVLKDTEVLHFKGYSTNGIVGKNVVKLMRESVGLAMATEEQGSRLFSNGAQIGKVFKHPGQMSDPTYKRLKAELNNATTGVENAHKSLILEDGMSIEATTLTMEDAQFLETRKFQVEDICSFLDVPLILINRMGDKSLTKGASAEVIKMFIDFQMAPDFVCWEQTLNKDLLYESEKRKYYIDFDFGALLRGDPEARSAYLQKRFETASITPNEIRLSEGESPTDTEEGDMYFLQSGMVPVHMAGMNISNNMKGAIKDGGGSDDNELNGEDDESTE